MFEMLSQRNHMQHMHWSTAIPCSRGVARLEQLNKLHTGNRDANGIILRNVWRKLGLDILVQQKTPTQNVANLG